MSNWLLCERVEQVRLFKPSVIFYLRSFVPVLFFEVMNECYGLVSLVCLSPEKPVSSIAHLIYIEYEERHKKEEVA